MRTTILIFIFMLSTFMVKAQKEANIWYFSEYAGLDFNSGFPISLNDGLTFTNEATSVISDSNGSLLFYTDGVSVWDKNHNIMPNGSGLQGHLSTTQTIIVKKPLSNSLYYIFTIDKEAGLDGFRYSIVDMSLNSGLGDINISKNVFIDSNVCEKVCAISHSNKIDYWIVVRYAQSNTFKSFLLSSTGLSSTPVISSGGTIITGGSRTIGYSKASLSGSKYVAANTWVNTVDLFDFDNSTGILSNPMVFTGFSGVGAYGVEFSPSEKYLYVSCYSDSLQVEQMDISSGIFSTINSSRTVIGTGTGRGGALQLGPDCKIYHARTLGSDSIGVINNPNDSAFASNYVGNAIYMDSNTLRLGLPVFPNSTFIKNSITFTSDCQFDSIYFNITDNNLDSVIWDFGDPSSGPNNSSTFVSPYHIYNSSGNYFVTLIYSKCGIFDTIIKSININPVPNVFLGADTSICQNQSLTLNSYYPSSTYIWQDNTTDSIFHVNQPGQYWVQVTNSCGSFNDTINVQIITLPNVSLPSDSFLCVGDSMILYSNNPNSTFLWNNGSTDSSLVVYQNGLYWLSVTTNGCENSDSILVSTPIINTLLDSSITKCSEDLINLNVSNPNSTYLWNNNSTNPNINVVDEGIYWVTISNICTSISDTIIITNENCSINIILPNVITPNGDGLNDIFKPITIEGIKRLNTQIFNRWGQELFNTDFLTVYWDGYTNAGKKVPNGTYFWVLKYVDRNDKKGTLKGTLQVLVD